MDKMKVEVCVLESFIPVRYRSREEWLVDTDTTVEELAPEEIEDGDWSAIVNGKTVQKDAWPKTLLGDRSQVIYTRLPSTPIVNLAIALFQVPLLGQIALSMVVSYGLAQLVGTPKVEAFDPPPDRTYSFSNLQQTATTGLPIQIVYGTHPVAGNVLELDLRGFNPAEGNNVYGSTLDMTIGLCEGEIAEVSDISVSGNAITSYGDLATWSSRTGTSEQTALGSAGTSTTVTVNAPITDVARVAANIYWLQGDWSTGSGISALLQAVNGDVPATVSATTDGTTPATGTASLYKRSGNNPNNDYIWIFNASAGSNLVTGGWSSGARVEFPGSGYSGLFHLDTQPFSQEGAVGNGPPTVDQVADVAVIGGESASYSTASAVDTARININFPQGLYTAGGSGLTDRTATAEIRFRNAATTPDTWSAWFSHSITSNQVGNFIWSIDMDFSDTTTWVPPAGSDPSIPQSYVIEVRDAIFQTGDGGYKMILDSVVEIVDQAYTYPNMAVVRTVISADEAISGSSIPNIVATVKGRKIGKWDEVSTVNPVLVPDSPDYNNPAWIVYDLLSNTRYGLGNWVSTSNIDIQSFQDWADWCNELVSDGAGGTEKRATWDGVIDRESSSWDACLMVCASARATLYTVGELIRVKFERDRSATQLFSMANVVEGSFSQSFVSRLDRPTRFDVRYLRADSSYQVDTAGVDDPDAIEAQLPQRTASAELAGITRESQALREARFRLNLEKLSTVVSWKSDIDSIACEPGDLVIFSHDVPKWGTSGRIVSATSTTVTLDADVLFGDMGTGNTYQIIVRHNADDTRETRDIAVAHANSTVSAGDPITIQAAWGTTPANLDQYTIGHATNFTRQIVITGIKTSGDLTRTIEGVVYDPAIHDDGVIVQSEAATYLPDPNQPPSAVRDLTTLEIGGTASSGKTVASIAVAWQYPSGTPIGGAKIYRKQHGTASAYTLIKTAQWPSTQEILEFDVVPLSKDAVVHEIAVVAFSTSGAHLPPTIASTTTFTPAGVTGIPDAVTGVTIEQDEGNLRIAWDGLSTSQVDHYEVRRGAQWSGGIFIGKTSETEIRTGNWSPTGSSGITENYMVRAVSQTKTYGPIGTATDTNNLGSWYGGTQRTSDFRDGGAWTNCTLSNLAVNADGDLEMQTRGSLSKVQTPTYVLSGADTYTFGVVAHARVEAETWGSSDYAWKSREGGALTWSGYIDASHWSSNFELQYRTRLSSSATWSALKPMTTQTAVKAFKEIELVMVVTPSDVQDHVIIEQLYLTMEAS